LAAFGVFVVSEPPSARRAISNRRRSESCRPGRTGALYRAGNALKDALEAGNARSARDEQRKRKGGASCRPFHFPALLSSARVERSPIMLQRFTDREKPRCSLAKLAPRRWVLEFAADGRRAH